MVHTKEMSLLERVSFAFPDNLDKNRWFRFLGKWRTSQK